MNSPPFTLQPQVFAQQRAQSASVHQILGAATHLSQFCLYQLHFHSETWHRVKGFNNRKLMEEMTPDASSPPGVEALLR